jgi:hypothetical protein
MATRKLSNELMAGIEQMKAHHQGKITLRSAAVPEPAQPRQPTAQPPPQQKGPPSR